MTNLTSEKEIDWAAEIDTLRYFWEQKDDLERYTGWNKLLPDLLVKYPEVVSAWEQYKTAQRMLTAVLRGLP